MRGMVTFLINSNLCHVELNGFGQRPVAPENIMQSGNNSQTLLSQEKNKMTVELNRYLKIQ